MVGLIENGISFPAYLETDRLQLFGHNPKLIHQLFQTKPKEEICAHFAYSEKQFNVLQEMVEKGMETNRISLFFFLLVDKKSKLPIGECGFHTWNSTHRRAELFYWLNSDEVKKQGFMSEALSAVIKYGFDSLNLHRIQGMVAPYNTPSVRLLMKNGFKFEGTAREDYVVDGRNEDSDCYSLLKHERLG